MTWPTGQARYLRAILAELRVFKPVPTSWSSTRGCPTRSATRSAGCSSRSATARSYGGGMKVCPGALMDDGLLSVTFLDELPHAHLPARVPDASTRARTSTRPEVHEHAAIHGAARRAGSGGVRRRRAHRAAARSRSASFPAPCASWCRGDRAARRHSLGGMDSPAERYAASRRRAADDRGRRCTSSAASTTSSSTSSSSTPAGPSRTGAGVLVAAPTGAGKTIVGEFAVHLALREGRKCFYTTPIKALSNQKFHDLVARYGADKVGLLTGDNTVNGEAPVVVMTTEVLRNMLYAGSHTLERARLRRDGRGALPRRPLPRRGVGGGDHPPARARGGGRALGHREQRRGVRRVALRGARRDAASSSRSTGRCRCGST